MEQHTVLVIDDDPHIAEKMRLLLPECRILAAYSGVDGIAMVRANPEAFDLVMLDLQMPHPGVLVAAQIRASAPYMRILPYSGVPAFEDELVALGCADLLPKARPIEEQQRHIRGVLAAPPPRALDNPLLPLILHHAAESEQSTLRQQAGACHVALLATPSLHAVLAAAIAGADAVLHVNAPNGRALRMTVSRARVALIIADMRMLAEAAAIAAEYTLPLLAVTFSLTAGYRACTLAQGVVIDPAQTAVFTAALNTVIHGERYHDPVLLAPLLHSPLSEREREVAYRLLQGLEAEEIAPLCSMSLDTARYHQRNICTKLGLKSLNQLPAWAETYTPDIP
jgi:DNA-binding NarL/FixJ family response regulator